MSSNPLENIPHLPSSEVPEEGTESEIDCETGCWDLHPHQSVRALKGERLSVYSWVVGVKDGSESCLLTHSQPQFRRRRGLV